MKTVRVFVISQEPHVLAEILRRNAARENFERMFGGGRRTHSARLGPKETVESNLPLPTK
jgi:hypothetical protein